MDRARLRRDRLHLPARLRDRPAGVRPGHGQARARASASLLAIVLWSIAAVAARVRRLVPVAASADGARRSAVDRAADRVRPPASRSRGSSSGSAKRATSRRRSRPSPSGSREGARAGDRHLQFRHQRRRAAHAARRAVDHAALRVGSGRSSSTGLTGLRLARLVGARLCAARGASAALAGRSSPTFAAIRRNRSRRCPGRRCSRYRQTWAFAIGKFLTDPIWWLYLFWIPDFLNKQLRPRSEDRSACRSSSSI